MTTTAFDFQAWVTPEALLKDGPRSFFYAARFKPVDVENLTTPPPEFLTCAVMAFRKEEERSGNHFGDVIVTSRRMMTNEGLRYIFQAQAEVVT